MKKDKKYDVAVIGLGAMGSSVLYHLSGLGLEVIGIDKYSPPHTLGSTHGDSRITRLAIGEGSQYVPLVKRSHLLWKDLEAKSGEKLFYQCGGLVIAEENNPFLQQTIASAKEYQIAHEILSASGIQKSYPFFQVSDQTVAFYEPSAGYLIPEKIVKAHLELSQKQGASLLFDSEVISLDKGEAKTSDSVIRADKIIVCAGPWMSNLLPEMKKKLKVYRQLLYWFPIESQYSSFQKMPIFIWEFGKSPDDFIYGFPAINGQEGGIKIATEEYQKEVSADIGSDPASDREIKKIYQEYIKNNFSGIGGEAIRTASCLYTNSEDSRFLIDEVRDGVWMVSACSGHGFKHCAAIGEALSQKVTSEESDISLDFFKNH